MGYPIHALSLLSTFLMALVTYAQEPRMQGVLEWGNITLHCNGADQLVIDHYDEVGRYRRDVLPLNGIDLATTAQHVGPARIEFVSDQDCGRCFIQEEFRMSTVRRSGRLSISSRSQGDAPLPDSGVVIAWIERLQQRSLLSETSTR